MFHGYMKSLLVLYRRVTIKHSLRSRRHCTSHVIVFVTDDRIRLLFNGETDQVESSLADT